MSNYETKFLEENDPRAEDSPSEAVTPIIKKRASKKRVIVKVASEMPTAGDLLQREKEDIKVVKRTRKRQKITAVSEGDGQDEEKVNTRSRSKKVKIVRKNTKPNSWLASVAQARSSLDLKAFQLLKPGSELYEKAKEIHNANKRKSSQAKEEE